MLQYVIKGCDSYFEVKQNKIFAQLTCIK